MADKGRDSTPAVAGSGTEGNTANLLKRFFEWVGNGKAKKTTNPTRQRSNSMGLVRSFCLRMPLKAQQVQEAAELARHVVVRNPTLYATLAENISELEEDVAHVKIRCRDVSFLISNNQLEEASSILYRQYERLYLARSRVLEDLIDVASTEGPDKQFAVHAYSFLKSVVMEKFPVQIVKTHRRRSRPSSPENTTTGTASTSAGHSSHTSPSTTSAAAAAAAGSASSGSRSTPPTLADLERQVNERLVISSQPQLVAKDSDVNFLASAAAAVAARSASSGLLLDLPSPTLPTDSANSGTPQKSIFAD